MRWGSTGRARKDVRTTIVGGNHGLDARCDAIVYERQVWLARLTDSGVIARD